MDKWERLNRELEQIREKNLLRKMTVFDTAQSSVDVYKRQGQARTAPPRKGNVPRYSPTGNLDR